MKGFKSCQWTTFSIILLMKGQFYIVCSGYLCFFCFFKMGFNDCIFQTFWKWSERGENASFVYLIDCMIIYRCTDSTFRTDYLLTRWSWNVAKPLKKKVSTIICLDATHIKLHDLKWPDEEATAAKSNSRRQGHCRWVPWRRQWGPPPPPRRSPRSPSAAPAAGRPPPGRGSP